MSHCTLLLFRHAATEANLRRPYILQGRKLDNPLCALGLEQARAAADAISSIPMTAILSSPLQRARKTAEILASNGNVSIDIAEELTELDCGEWEGLSWEEIGTRWPEEFARFQEDQAAVGYLGGENFHSCLDRALPTIEDFARRHRGRTVAAVSHNVVNRILLAHWLGIPLKYARRLPQDNAGYSVIELGDAAKVRSVNLAAHLAELVPPE